MLVLPGYPGTGQHVCGSGGKFKTTKTKIFTINYILYIQYSTVQHCNIYTIYITVRVIIIFITDLAS